MSYVSHLIFSRHNCNPAQYSMYPAHSHSLSAPAVFYISNVTGLPHQLTAERTVDERNPQQSDEALHTTENLKSRQHTFNLFQHNELQIGVTCAWLKSTCCAERPMTPMSLLVEQSMQTVHHADGLSRQSNPRLTPEKKFPVHHAAKAAKRDLIVAALRVPCLLLPLYFVYTRTHAPAWPSGPGRPQRRT